MWMSAYSCPDIIVSARKVYSFLTVVQANAHTNHFINIMRVRIINYLLTVGHIVVEVKMAMRINKVHGIYFASFAFSAFGNSGLERGLSTPLP
jgi:hypothetical protein